MEITFTTPIITKKRALRFGKGRAYKTRESIESEKSLKYEAWTQRRGKEPLITPVKMTVLFRKKGRRGRADLDGMAATVLDALIGVAYKDDSQVHDLHVKWSDTLAAPTTAHVFIEEL